MSTTVELSGRLYSLQSPSRSQWINVALTRPGLDDALDFRRKTKGMSLGAALVGLVF